MIASFFTEYFAPEISGICIFARRNFAFGISGKHRVSLNCAKLGCNYHIVLYQAPALGFLGGWISARSQLW
jgi:hypothetical protein